MANCFVIMPFRPELGYLYRGVKQYLEQAFPGISVVRGDDQALTVPLLQKIADYIRQAVKQLIVPHRRQNLPTITMSAGVATYPDHGPMADAVLRAADTALYQAKSRGRDVVVLNQTGGLFPEAMVEYGRRPERS